MPLQNCRAFKIDPFPKRIEEMQDTCPPSLAKLDILCIILFNQGRLRGAFIKLGQVFKKNLVSPAQVFVQLFFVQRLNGCPKKPLATPLFAKKNWGPKGCLTARHLGPWPVPSTARTLCAPCARATAWPRSFTRRRVALHLGYLGGTGGYEKT